MCNILKHSLSLLSYFTSKAEASSLSLWTWSISWNPVAFKFMEWKGKYFLLKITIDRPKSTKKKRWESMMSHDAGLG